MRRIYTEIETRDSMYLKDFSRGKVVRINHNENGKPFQIIPGKVKDNSRSRWQWSYRKADWEEARDILAREGVCRPEERLEAVGGVMEGHDYWFEVQSGDFYSGEVLGIEQVDEGVAEVYVQSSKGVEVVKKYERELPEDLGPETVIDWGYSWD